MFAMKYFINPGTKNSMDLSILSILPHGNMSVQGVDVNGRIHRNHLKVNLNEKG